MLALSLMIETEHTDAVNSKILAIAEDRIQGFVREPFSEIARLSGVGLRLRRLFGVHG